MTLLLFVVLFTQIVAIVGQGGCDTATFPSVVMIIEGTVKGQQIYNLSDQDDVVLVPYDKPLRPPFIELVNGSFVTNVTIEADNNETMCNILENIYDYGLFAKCAGTSSPERRIDFEATFVDNFPPEFTTTYEAEIQEMVMVDTTVLKVDRAEITDPDCGSKINLGVDTYFALESGNRNAAFRMDRDGSMKVNRLLDYENGDTNFLLNISVFPEDNSLFKSFTTVNVTVVDIDDSDPVFNLTHYTLTVREEDNSSVGQWLDTEPPVFVFDPDVSAQDPLIVSLFDPSETRLEVNLTGGVKLTTVFDYEQLSSFEVVLKVAQNVSSWRSSTAVLTVQIIDINDNRPQFHPSAYTFTIVEHAPAGTAVGLVYATDLDSGDNGKFNYTLQSHDDIFSLETVADGMYGILRVLNSTLLDREDHDQLSVQIGTDELMPPVGPNCNGACDVTVDVILLDINDNSPVFHNSSYYVMVTEAYITNDVIITIHATDLDEGPNGDVTYRIRNFQSSLCNDIMINDTTGDVIMTRSVTQFLDCSQLVDACDSPLESSQRRCTSVPLRVDMEISNYTLPILTSVNTEYLLPVKTELETKLSNELNVTVSIRNIGQRENMQGSEVVISATNKTSGDHLLREHLKQLVDANSDSIEAIFQSYVTSPTTTPTVIITNRAANDFSAHVIALIVVAGVLLIALIVAVVFIARGRKSHKRQKRLIQGLSITNDIYITAELSKDDDDSTASILPRDEEDPVENLGVINPIFQDDDDPSLPTITPRSDTDEASLKGEETMGQSEVPSRFADADSGVPSDRENGAGESDDSHQPSPMVARNEGSMGPGGSDYLNAVLSNIFIASNTDDENDSDVADVTSPLPLYENTKLDLHSDSQFRSVPHYENTGITPVLSMGTSETIDRSAQDDEQDVQQDFGDDVKEPDGSAITTDSTEGITEKNDIDDTTEEVETVLNFDEEPDDTSVDHSPSSRALLLESFLQQHLNKQNQPQQPASEDVKTQESDDDEDDSHFGSKLSQLMRPSTPPMQRAGAAKEEEEEEYMPDEPEPDYAKKVRFSAQVTEHNTPKGKSDTITVDEEDESLPTKEMETTEMADDGTGYGQSVVTTSDTLASDHQQSLQSGPPSDPSTIEQQQGEAEPVSGMEEESTEL